MLINFQRQYKKYTKHGREKEFLKRTTQPIHTVQVYCVYVTEGWTPEPQTVW